MSASKGGLAGQLPALGAYVSDWVASRREWILGASAVGILAALGGYLMLYVTPIGIGLGNDSIEYIAAARSLAGGGGIGRLTCSGFKPLTQWGPLYSVVLAGFGPFGYDAIRAARAVSAAGFAGTIFLGGMAALVATKRVTVGVTAAVLLLASQSTLRSFSWAMSEPLYVPLALAALMALGEYLKSDNLRWLVGGAFFVSLALLTRYAGLSLLAAGCLALALNPARVLRRRLGDISLLAGVSLIPFVGWWLRNLVVSGSSMYGEVSLALASSSYTQWFLASIAPWLWPGPSSVDGDTATGIAIGILVVAAIWTEFREWKRSALLRQSRIGWLLGLHTFVYPFIVIGAKNILNPFIDFSSRMWVPMHVTFVVLLPIVAWRIVQGRGRWASVPAITAIGLLVALYGWQQSTAIREVGSNGQGFASWAWRASRSGTYLRNLSDTVIYTNDIQAVYFTSGKPSCAIPTPTSSGTLEQMRARVMEGGGLVVIFGELSAEFLPLDLVTAGL